MSTSPMDFTEVGTRLQRLERLVAGVPAEAGALWHDLQAVKRHLVQCEAVMASLELEASQLRKDLSRLDHELGATQRRGAATAGRFVAIHRLHSTLHRGLMFQALDEIVASLVGCEEMAVFGAVGAPATLQLVHAVGITSETLTAQRLIEQGVERSRPSEGLWIAEHRGACDRREPVLTAWIPLDVDGRRVGGLALYRLLEHKAQLEQGDIELLDLLRLHLGVALVATRTETLAEAS